MLPPAPGLLSTITDCFHSVESLSATMRHSASFEPPGGNGTTMRTPLSGQVWACAGRATARSAAISRRKRSIMHLCYGMSLRDAITSAYRRPEPECVPPLIEAATLSAETMAHATALARRLVERMRAKGQGGGVEGLIHEYSLASEEGVALMCLAEALLRIPDDETRDALIRDKIGGGDWQAHLGKSPSLFVNAATWGLLLTGRLTATHSERGLTSALARLVAKGGEPLIRAGVNLVMRLMGEQF